VFGLGVPSCFAYKGASVGVREVFLWLKR